MFNFGGIILRIGTYQLLIGNRKGLVDLQRSDAQCDIIDLAYSFCHCAQVLWSQDLETES